MKKIIVPIAAILLLFGMALPVEVIRAAMTTEVVAHPSVYMISRILKQGMSGDDVRLLQQLLASDSEVYPEGITTGYYGALTAKAVKKFQKKHNLSQVGQVGPMTREKMNNFILEALKGVGITATSTATSTAIKVDIDDDRDEGKDLNCAKVPPGHLIAPGQLKKGNRAELSPCQVLPPGIAKKLHDGWNRGTTTPPVSSDKTAPFLSSISASAITSSGATITWNTNELANSKVYWGTTSSVSTSSPSVSNNSAVLTHSVQLAGLAANTVYYYRVESVDAAGNSSLSAVQSFTTTQADAIAPVISAIAVSGISSTSATIGWTTNEAATSKVYYATTTPVSLSTALLTSNASMVTSHSLTLTGLSATTTYYFFVTSADSSNNTATSSESGFVTTQ